MINKPIHMSLPLLPGMKVTPPPAYFRYSGASPLKHSALMKRCYVGSDEMMDWKNSTSLEISGTSLHRGRLLLPVRGEEARLCQKKKKPQKCDWCHWTTIARQSSIWINCSLSRCKLQYPQVNMIMCVSVSLFSKVNECQENYIFGWNCILFGINWEKVETNFTQKCNDFTLHSIMSGTIWYNCNNAWSFVIGVNFPPLLSLKAS